MTETTTVDTRGGYRSVSIALFLCLFAGQAALIAMSPVLAKAASDLHVSAAAAGQRALDVVDPRFTGRLGMPEHQERVPAAHRPHLSSP